MERRHAGSMPAWRLNASGGGWWRSRFASATHGSGRKLLRLPLPFPLGLAGCDISGLQAVKERRRLLGHRCGGRAPASTWATILSVTR
ncbi:hypothetical protein NDN16_18390 [Aureimonas altamirensis]|uniref:hypothetical protein n=1 Tax=Aureimonas altamirensis TaxID=370622 RepID=UPI0020370A8A|nr:hypothetical protein [Aureimonas altamirensis]MCM2505639.1 hypothetical protein [Aureimonas altamirensis]